MEELLLVGRFNNLWVKPHVSPFSDKCPCGVAPLMAVSAVPIMAAVGMAVDYSRVNAARTAFQSALDATALMVSKDATIRGLACSLAGPRWSAADLSQCHRLRIRCTSTRTSSFF